MPVDEVICPAGHAVHEEPVIMPLYVLMGHFWHAPATFMSLIPAAPPGTTAVSTAPVEVTKKFAGQFAADGLVLPKPHS